MRIPTIFGIAIILFAQLPVAAAQGTLHWETNLDAAQAKAAATNRPVLVEFTAPWCGVCQKMHKEVLSLPEVESRIAQTFVPTKVNVDHYPNLGKKYGITGLPTVAIVTPDGRCLEKHRGALTRDQLLATISRFESTPRVAASPRTPNPAAMAPPTSRYGESQPNPADATGPPQNRLANRPASPQGASLPAVPSPATPRGRYAQPYQGPYQQTPATTSTTQNGAAPPEHAGPSIPNPSNNQSAPAAPQASQAQPQNDFGQNWHTSPNTGQNRPANTGIVAPNTNDPRHGIPAQHGPAHGSSVVPQPSQPVQPMQPAALQQRQATLPSGSPAPSHTGTFPSRPDVAKPTAPPSFAMEGFCPVTLVETRVWKKGDRRWGARHEGQVYLFTGPGEQQRFLANPNRYSPVASGMDVVLFVEQGQQQPGTREHGVFFGDRIYLFSSEESLQRFTTKPHHYTAGITAGRGRKADLPQRTTYRR